ncbi:hypothetical protein QFZ68_005773 [Streptomyces sp. V1I6]|nr:hypothetical protein [Streptomyces sp. V1I6]
MVGSVRLAGESGTRAMRLDLAVRAEQLMLLHRTTVGTLTGRVRIAGLADDRDVRGELEISPIARRRIRYRLDFTADGRRHSFDGWKSVSALRPVKSMTVLPLHAADRRRGGRAGHPALPLGDCACAVPGQLSLPASAGRRGPGTASGTTLERQPRPHRGLVHHAHRPQDPYRSVAAPRADRAGRRLPRPRARLDRPLPARRSRRACPVRPRTVGAGSRRLQRGRHRSRARSAAGIRGRLPMGAHRTPAGRAPVHLSALVLAASAAAGRADPSLRARHLHGHDRAPRRRTAPRRRPRALPPGSTDTATPAAGPGSTPTSAMGTSSRSWPPCPCVPD